MKILSNPTLSLVCLICLFASARAANTLDCNFEDEDLCGYTQDETDDTDWKFAGNSTKWDLAQISIAANAQPFQLILEGGGTGEYTGEIGINDIAVKPRICADACSNIANCNSDYCVGHWCTKCNDHYFLRGNVCSQCFLYCQKCAGHTCYKCRDSECDNACEIADCPFPCSGMQSVPCTSCPVGFYLRGSFCYTCFHTACKCSIATDCIGCLPGRYDTASFCEKRCPIDCITCSNSLNCSECVPGKYGPACSLDCVTQCQDGSCDRVSGLCFNTCPADQYLDSNQRCRYCPLRCNSCINSLQCLSCTTTYWGQTCEHNCTGCYDNCNRVTGCSSKCIEKYYRAYNEDINGYECVSCPDNCITCISSTECTSCDYDYWGTYCQHRCLGCWGGCSKTTGCGTHCMLGHYPEKVDAGYVCMDCLRYCENCSTYNLCHICLNGYYVGNDQICVPCSAHCIHQLCEQTNGTCIGGCIDGFSGLQCSQTCPVHCLKCKQFDANVCDTCEIGFYGYSCENSCNKTCNPSDGLNPCHKSDGSCVFGCKNGYWGSNCDIECSMYCASSSEAIHQCNATSGDCHNGCVNGRYGEHCTLACSEYCEGGTCFQQNGTCTIRYVDTVKGSISRVCNTNGTCIRPSFADVENKLTKNVSQSDVSDVLSELVELTNTRGDATKMSSGEIESVTRSLDIVATLANTDIPPTEEQSKSFITIASNLLSEDNRRSWESLPQPVVGQPLKSGGGVSMLLQSIDSYSEAMTKTLEERNTSVVTIIQPNIVLEVRKVDMSQDKIEYPMPSQKHSENAFAGAKLSLPLQNGSASEFQSYTVTVYTSLAGILPDRSASRDDDKDEGTLKLNSRVISFQLFPYRSELYKPLTLTFNHEQPNFRNAVCSYWSFLDYQWATHGCRVKISDGAQTVCECDHLTNFAVLMSPWSEPTADSTAIEIISIVGCSISIVCLIATAALHLSHWRYIKNDQAVLLVNVCAALFATYIIFLAGINQTDHKVACTAVAALLHYIALVVFCLMLAEGIEITITVKYVFLKESRLKWMLPLAWGIPAVIVGLSLGITKLNGYGTENFCWLSVDGGVIWAFVGPALLVIVANVVFLAILLRTMLTTKAYIEKSAIDRVKCSVRCLCVLVPMMGCTWVLGIFYVNDRTTWIQYIFALCNSLQGFSIFLFHGLLNKKLHTAIKSRYKKYKDSHSVSKTHAVSKSHGTRPTEIICANNPVYASTIPVESKSDHVKKHGRKLQLQYMKTGSYSPKRQGKP